VKLPPRPESAPGQFEGRTPAEAVQLARAEFGRDAPVRCWKTRTGGVLGFFAREAFVAGISPPAGAVKAVKTPRPAKEPKEPKEAREAREAREAGAAVPPELAPPPPPARASLSELVEDTSDELTLGSAPVPAAVFSEVLAEAQAAVNGADLLEHRAWPAPAVKATPVHAPPAWVEGLDDSLVRIGVPVEYRPPASEATLDGLARALATLPVAPAVPSDGGSVIVVVGAGRDAQVAAGAVVERLGLESSVLLPVECTDVGRQRVARRRSSNKVTVLVVEATLRSRRLATVASWLEQVKPDFVLGAVPATAKRADVAHWGAQVGPLQALALSRLAHTASPGELMGLLPITSLDGEEASTLRWVHTLLGATMARAR
jgi:hypothetical protein